MLTVWLANLHYSDIPKTRGDKVFRQQRVIELQKLVESELNNCSIPNIVKSLPNDDEIEQAATEEASRIFDGTGSDSEWYAKHNGFTDGVKWLKNHLVK